MIDYGEARIGLALWKDLGHTRRQMQGLENGSVMAVAGSMVKTLLLEKHWVRDMRVKHSLRIFDKATANLWKTSYVTIARQLFLNAANSVPLECIALVVERHYVQAAPLIDHILETRMHQMKPRTRYGGLQDVRCLRALCRIAMWCRLGRA